MTPLEDIVTISTGKKDANYGTKDGKYHFFTCADEYLLAPDFSFEGPAILMPGNGANVGKVYYFNGEFEAYQRTYVLQVIDNKNVDINFIYLHLQGFWSDYIKNKQRGSATNYIVKERIAKYEVPLPPLSEQKQIVSKIKEYFTLLDKSEAKLRFAEEKLDKVMDSAIVKYIEEEGKNKEWDFKSIKDICEINPSKTEIKELPLDTKVAFVQMSSVSDKTGTIETQEIRTLEEVKKGYTFFKKGDIIFAKITPCMENGKTSLTDNLETKYGFGSTEFHVLRVNNHKILPEYLYIILRSQRFRKLAMTNMTGTAGQKRLPKDYLAEYKIYVPSIEEQKNIVTKLHKIEAERTNYNSIYEKSLSRLSNLRQSILKKAFEGKLI
jgi:type I restriction enzyme S subunit